MTRIVGLDVSKSSVSCCLLTEKPSNPREFYYEYRFHKFECTTTGLTGLLLLKPQLALLEPTGMNYSKFWVEHLTRLGVEVRFVGHKQLRNYRENHLGLPDKDDDADSLALACYQFDYGQDLSRFVQVRDRIISRIRELVLRLNHLSRIQSPIINRARQDLAWQFPEIALTVSVRGVSGKVPLMWGWLAGERDSKKYDRIYATTAGLGLTDSVKFHAQRICSLQLEEQLIEDELYTLIMEERFSMYREVFQNFNFGARVQAVILSQIYPLENFLGEDGKPEIKIRKGRKSGKPTKRHLSLRRFQKALGVAPSMESSGDISKSKVSGGSSLCRRALWQWVFSAVEPAKRRTNPILKELGEFLDVEKAAGKPIKLARMRVAVRAVKLLFKMLT
ncbi:MULTISPECIES: transposase [unclassified Nodularia (in: cyanobacteria)]|uniref:IS110 family transposase n=1 Tax=unclassified Nodularia (in: cyanobacteria) TaxID=2656917 RepID=UPI00187EEDF7|nr:MULTISPECIES: transposase [unclassified Nodularia (in: cyanobacteria)]MBE9201509.1 transposase [Nodularia sp. LEGE 06071]MCC2695794.1 transposase [Nodularia sp. LEGE 04288]